MGRGIGRAGAEICPYKHGLALLLGEHGIEGGRISMTELLQVKNLKVSFKTFTGEVQAVRGVNFSLNAGETLAIVGESGCGKSVTAHTIMGLIPEPPGFIKGGEVIYDGVDLTKLTDRQMEGYRGSEIGIVFQDPMTSLNPTMKIGMQIVEALVRNKKISRNEAKEKACEMLKLVGIPQGGERVNQYPHQFSGGMKQRVMLAIALASSPKILIADEPTTSLDVTIQAQIIDLLINLQKKLNMGIILITHDLGVVANIADKVAVMYAGKIIEAGTLDGIFYFPRHPYTQGLLKSVPEMGYERTKKLFSIEGTPPDLCQPPLGCAFAPRCSYAKDICYNKYPEENIINDNHRVSCWLEYEQGKEKVYREDWGR